jgi:hypothetical protein
VKITKTQIKALEDEDREIIAQTEADFEAGKFVPVRHAPGEKAAIMAAAREAVEWSRSLKGKPSSTSVTVHVKVPRSASVKTSARNLPTKASGKAVRRKASR